MKRIYKYELGNSDEQTIKTKYGAKPLSVQIQEDQIVLWALIEDKSHEITKKIQIVGTGNPITFELMDYQYVGTVQDGPMVWHIFYEL